MSTQRKIYLLIFSIIILASSAIIYIVFYLINGINRDSQELIIQKRNSIYLETKIKDLDQIKDAYYNFENNFKEVDKLFINSDVPVEFIGFLEKISKDNQIKTKIYLASSSKTNKDVWPFIDFQINTEGSYANVLRFIQKIENAFYLAEIQNITLSQSGEPGRVEATFLLKIHTE